jgi:hypothetical protein
VFQTDPFSYLDNGFPFNFRAVKFVSFDMESGKSWRALKDAFKFLREVNNPKENVINKITAVPPISEPISVGRDERLFEEMLRVTRNGK